MNRVLVASKIIIAASKTTLAASKIHPRFLSPPEVIPVASKAWVASKDLSPPRHLKEYVAITFPRIQSKSTPYKKNENECSSLSFNSFKEFQVSLSSPDKICDNVDCIAFRELAQVYSDKLSYDRTDVECNDTLSAKNYIVLRLRFRNCGLPLKCSEGTVSDLRKELEKIKDENDHLILTNVAIEDLKLRNQYLELRDKKHIKTIEGKDEKIKDLENKLQAYANSANLEKEIISSQVVGGKLGIGLDYDELRESSKKHVVENEPVIKIVNPPDTPHVLEKY
ncbi:hypothetical protein ACET3Z_031485 [Daucus carota]